MKIKIPMKMKIKMVMLIKIAFVKRQICIFSFSFLLIFSLIFSACRGALQVDRVRDFKSRKTNIGKIVCIDPDFELLTTTGNRKTERQYKRASAKEIQLNNILVRNARKNNLTLELVDTERLLPSNMDYFSQLAPLKHEILQVSFLQDFLNRKKRRNQQKVFNRYENGPIIASHFSYLADQYNTPYFAVQGITTHRKPNKGRLILLLTAPPFGIADFFSPEADTYYYTIIADVVRAEIVYREIRKVDAPASDTNLNALVYDSFNIISQ